MHALADRLIRPDSRLQGWLVGALLGVLSVVLAVQLARLTWLLWPRPPQAEPPPPPAAAVEAPGGAAQQSVDLAGMHLMGEAPARETARPAVIEAPETRLNLQLRGVLHNTANSLARAIIASGGQSEEFYKTGAQLPGGAVLDDIYPEKVILRRGARYETLSLPQETLEGAGESDAPPQARRSPRAAAPRRSADSGALGQIREQLTADPTAIQRYLQPVPAVNESTGRMIGFRLTPGQDPTLFRATGLRPDDVVTSIGGIPLSDPDNGFLALEQLSSGDQVTLTVLREGTEQTLELQFQ